jgi:thiamine transport system substrate-binding protein
MIIKKFVWILFLVTLVISACAGPQSAATPVVTTGAVSTIAVQTVEPAQAATLTVMTHDSFAASEQVIADFEKENNVKLVFLKGGDAGAALNRAILSKDSPQADVFYGVDNTFLSRALEAGIFEPYNSPLLKDIKPEYQLDAGNNALPVDFGDICINYDKAYFKNKNLKVPATLEDLIMPEYQGLLVVESPSTSSTGLGFLLATIQHFGESKFLEYWKQLRSNQVVVVNDWETAYYTNFSGSSGKGQQPMVVSYGTSPAAEVVFAATPITESPTASIVGEDTCFRQIEFAGILKGTKQRALAEKFIDFMLGKKFQEDIPLQMFVFPVNGNAVLPEVFTKSIQVPEKPAMMDANSIGKMRSQWIQKWDETVLR